MIERVAAQMLGPAAASHVEAMYDESGVKHGVSKAPGVACVARTFEAMDDDDLAEWINVGSLRVDQDLDTGIGIEEAHFDWESLKIGGPPPVVAGDGGEVRIAKQRNEGLQTTILVSGGGDGSQVAPAKIEDESGRSAAW